MQYAQTAMVPRATIMATEVEWLKYIKADLVVLSYNLISFTTKPHVMLIYVAHVLLHRRTYH